jgi:hypothetical protein
MPTGREQAINGYLMDRVLCGFAVRDPGAQVATVRRS